MDQHIAVFSQGLWMVLVTRSTAECATKPSYYVQPDALCLRQDRCNCCFSPLTKKPIFKRALAWTLFSKHSNYQTMRYNTKLPVPIASVFTISLHFAKYFYYWPTLLTLATIFNLILKAHAHWGMMRDVSRTTVFHSPLQSAWLSSLASVCEFGVTGRANHPPSKLI